MAEMLILWSGADGQTRCVVQVIEDAARRAGYRLQVVNADAPPRYGYIGKADALCIVAWGEGGDYSPELRGMLQRMNGSLAAMPSAFVTVSLTAAVPGSQEEPKEYAAAFLAEVGWQPTMLLSVAGALRYPEYGRRQRREMKRLAKRLGLPKDTSLVHEFTDWARVRLFARQFVEEATARIQGAAALDEEASQLYDLAG